MLSSDESLALSQAYAFLGNSLLKPMSRTLHVGLDASFWESFPDFGDRSVADALVKCVAFARYAAEDSAHGIDVVERVSVEYTKLFVGPPKPLAAPWETVHRRGGVSVGFGEATFQMRSLLRDAGMALVNENRQYEDHMGIELLYLSELCRRRASALDGDEAPDDAFIRSFVVDHPLAWMDSLAFDVGRAYPEGYFAALLGVAESILRWHASR